MLGIRIMPFDAPSVASPDGAARVWTVTLGWNHAEDTVECLHSLQASRGVRLRLLYVDNGSREEEVRRVLEAVPEADVIRHEQNVGVSRGFNAGLARALHHGADYIFMANNDTTVEPDTLARLVEAAERDPRAGIVMPTIYFHEAPDVVWSAGSRFRFFPPAIVMNRKPPRGERPSMDFSPLCTALVRAEALKAAGLMDPTYLYYFEDYDLSLRIRDAGYGLRLVPGARSTHKVERVTRPGSGSPAHWENCGRSAGIFRQRHGQRHPWMAGTLMLAYVAARTAVESRGRALRSFRAGLRAGRGTPLRPIPAWNDDAIDPVTVRRECGTIPPAGGE